MRLNLTQVKLLNATEPPETYRRWERNKPQILTIEMPDPMQINPTAPIFITQNPDIDPDFTQVFYTIPERGESHQLQSLHVFPDPKHPNTQLRIDGALHLDPTKPIRITQDPNHG